jgi:hypothetical protein
MQPDFKPKFMIKKEFLFVEAITMTNEALREKYSI